MAKMESASILNKNYLVQNISAHWTRLNNLRNNIKRDSWNY